MKSLELRLFSAAPIDAGLEVEKVAFGLQNMVDGRGAYDARVKKRLAGKTPRARGMDSTRSWNNSAFDSFGIEM